MTAVVQPAIVIRQAVESDAPLIYSSWLRSYWNARPAALEAVEHAVYQQGQRARIDALLAKHGARVVCNPEVPDAIMGWSCDAYGSLHYVYTRHMYRRMGVAALLLGDAAAPFAATHITDAFRRCFPSIPYNPYLLEQT